MTLTFEDILNLNNALAPKSAAATKVAAEGAGTDTSHPTGGIEFPNTTAVSEGQFASTNDTELKDNAVAPTVNDAPENPESNDNPAKADGLNAAAELSDASGISTTQPDPGTTLAAKAAAYTKMSTAELVAEYTKQANQFLADSIAAAKPADTAATAANAASTPAPKSANEQAAEAGYNDAAAAGAQEQHQQKVAYVESLIELGLRGGRLFAERTLERQKKAAEDEAPPVDAPPAEETAAPSAEAAPPPAADAGAPPADPAMAGGGEQPSKDQIIQELLNVMTEMGITPDDLMAAAAGGAPAGGAAGAPPAEMPPPPPAAEGPEKMASYENRALLFSYAKEAKATKASGGWGFTAVLPGSKQAKLRHTLRTFIREIVPAR